MSPSAPVRFFQLIDSIFRGAPAVYSCGDFYASYSSGVEDWYAQ